MKPLHNQLMLAFDGVVLTVGEWIALHNQQFHADKAKDDDLEDYDKEDLRTPDTNPPEEKDQCND